ncbi:hypothetical protein [Leptodesmis sp.]|uniref:hypothetical protein n=1 Tax=Leptodesmis sp. TaxID=3100501 RepID=UPI00405352F1
MIDSGNCYFDWLIVLSCLCRMAAIEAIEDLAVQFYRSIPLNLDKIKNEIFSGCLKSI